MVPPLEDGIIYVQAAAGRAHTVLLRSDGCVVAFGDSRDGQCAVPSLPDGVTYTHVSAGALHTVLLRSDNVVMAFGNSEDDQCTVPTLKDGVMYTQVAAGMRHTVLLRSDGTAVVFGFAYNSEFAPPLPDGLTYTQVAAGSGHTVLLRSDGVAVAFGEWGSRQCRVPPLQDGVTYTQVAAGGMHTVLLRSDGSAVAFGNNTDGQIQVPRLPYGVTYTQAAAGTSHTVLLRSDGTAIAFGCNTDNQCRIHNDCRYVAFDRKFDDQMPPPLHVDAAARGHGPQRVPGLVSIGATEPTGHVRSGGRGRRAQLPSNVPSSFAELAALKVPALRSLHSALIGRVEVDAKKGTTLQVRRKCYLSKQQMLNNLAHHFDFARETTRGSSLDLHPYVPKNRCRRSNHQTMLRETELISEVPLDERKVSQWRDIMRPPLRRCDCDACTLYAHRRRERILERICYGSQRYLHSTILGVAKIRLAYEGLDMPEDELRKATIPLAELKVKRPASLRVEQQIDPNVPFEFEERLDVIFNACRGCGVLALPCAAGVLHGDRCPYQNSDHDMSCRFGRPPKDGERGAIFLRYVCSAPHSVSCPFRKCRNADRDLISPGQRGRLRAKRQKFADFLAVANLMKMRMGAVSLTQELHRRRLLREDKAGKCQLA